MPTFLRFRSSTCPNHQPQRLLMLVNLSNTLIILFEKDESAGDLNESIVLYRDALKNCRDDHPLRSLWMSRANDALRVRFKCGKDLADLDGSLELQRIALAMHPDAHPDHLT